MRISFYITIGALLSGCAGPSPSNGEPHAGQLSVPERPPGWAQLHERAGGDVREGTLEALDDGIRLHLRRANQTRPFLHLDYPDRRETCYLDPEAEPDSDDSVESSESTWWLFSGADDVVGLELAAEGMFAWHWDRERRCEISRPVLPLAASSDAPPREYYQADDVQVGYRWNNVYQDETGPVIHEVDGNREVDLAVVEGTEQVVVERDAVSILAADGRALLHETFEWNEEQPCYDSQLSIFERPNGGLYAIVSWESFGSPDSCEKPSKRNHYRSIIAEWKSPQRGFVRTYRIDERERLIQTQSDSGPAPPEGESTSLELLRVLEVPGGRLEVDVSASSLHVEGPAEQCAEREAATGDCLKTQECWRWRAERRRRASYVFVAEGVRIPLGDGRRDFEEVVLDCAPVYP